MKPPWDTARFGWGMCCALPPRAAPVSDPDKKISRDFVVTISLMWKLPDWISNLMIDRGMVYIRENDRRHQALEYIRTVLWDRGIEEANKYLTGKGLSPLSI